MAFRGILVTQTVEGGKVTEHSAEVRDLDEGMLAPGGVTVAVDYSSLNYKDAMALTGRPGIVKSSPLIPGIDLVGTVDASDHPDWAPGERVILNGAGIGESHHGGLATRARVAGDALVRLPEAISPKQAAQIGTAGFTAMLSVLALERSGVAPDSGDVLVTGASGGVGSMATALLAARGYRVTASTGRTEESAYLKRLGAHDVIDRAELSEPGRPLQRQRWAGAVDSVGSHTLVNVLAQTVWGGTVTACGLAQGPDLPGTVLPFILRAVNLAGVNSVDAPRGLREQAWQRLATDLDLGLLEELAGTISLQDALDYAPRVLAGQVRGRLAVDVRQ